MVKTTLKSLCLGLLILIISTQTSSANLIKEESFLQDSQAKSFLVFMLDILPSTQSKDEFWSISPYSLDFFKLSTGQVVRRYSLQTHSYCVSENNNNYMLYSLNKAQHKLYAFNLKSGKLVGDFKLPGHKVNVIPQVKIMSCLEQGLELEIELKSKKSEFIFYKNYDDEDISITDSSIVDSTKKLENKEIYMLDQSADKRGNKYYSYNI